MHEIRCRLRVCTRPRWGSSQHLPRPPSWILGGPTSDGRRGRKEDNREREGRGKEGSKKGGEGGKGKERGGEVRRLPTLLAFLAAPL